MKDLINKILSEIEDSEGVKILIASEAGSRAMGYDSPNSDYDVRFIYVKKTEDYLTLKKVKDFIDIPFSGELDIHGWDITKALTLFSKGNCAVTEWINSPIIYRDVNSKAIDGLKKKSQEVLKIKPSIYHHYHMSYSIWQKYIQGEDSVPVKKYLYAIRSLIACLWISTNRTYPPIQISEMIKSVKGLDQEFLIHLGNLISLKKKSKEDLLIKSVPYLEGWLKKYLMVCNPNNYEKEGSDLLDKGSMSDEEKDYLFKLAREDFLK